MTNNNLSSLWLKDEIKKQNGLLGKLIDAFNSLKDNSTSYADGIKTMIDIRKKIIELLIKEQVERGL